MPDKVEQMHVKVIIVYTRETPNSSKHYTGSNTGTIQAI